MRVAFLDLDGTLLGPGGSLFTDARRGFTDAGGRALRLLREARVHVVLVSGRARAELADIAGVLGADDIIPELGAGDAGYSCPPGRSVVEAIEATGIVAEVIAASGGGLARFARPGRIREATVLLRGIAPAGIAEIVAERSGGALRLADNGRIAADGTRAFHLAPAGAGKGPAVARYLAARDVVPGTALAVGNSAEDLAMTDAGVRVALVGNVRTTDPDLAARAAWVTDASYGAGVLEAVSAWLASG